MFWRSKSSKIPLEPKTPRLPSIPLHPDPRYIPMPYHQPYDPSPPFNYPQAAPMVDPRYNLTEPIPRKPRSRTVSTPSVKGMLDPSLVFCFCFWSTCEAPTPIPSQGRFIPNVDHLNRMTRANSSQARPAPVAGMNLAFCAIFCWFRYPSSSVSGYSCRDGWEKSSGFARPCYPIQ